MLWRVLVQSRTLNESPCAISSALALTQCEEFTIELGQPAFRLLFTGLAMATTYPLIGCLRTGSDALPPAQFSSASTGLSPNYSSLATAPQETAPQETAPQELAAAERLPTEQSNERLPTLPNGLEPPIPSRNWKYIVLHHTATDAADVATIDEDHRQRKDQLGKPWLGIGYHFVIGNGQGMPDGLVEPTFRWEQQLHGAHAGTRPYNELGIGICLVGNFVENRPTARQVAACRDLIRSLADRYAIEPAHVMRHQDLTATECPGPLFPFQEIVGHEPPETPFASPSSERRAVLPASSAMP
jgi:hypothetical protein